MNFDADPPRLDSVPWGQTADGTTVATTLGPTWTATTVCPPDGWAIARLRLLAARLGTPAADKPAWRGRLTVAHDGRPPVTVPGRVPLDFIMSPDGRWLAGLDDGGRVELWATDPPSPWPRAVAAGMLTVAAWATLDRRRSRRAAR